MCVGGGGCGGGVGVGVVATCDNDSLPLTPISEHMLPII